MKKEEINEECVGARAAGRNKDKDEGCAEEKREMKKLSQIKISEACTVGCIGIAGVARERLAELGLISGVRVVCLGESPLGDPRAYRVLDGVVAVRCADAERITVLTDNGQ